MRRPPGRGTPEQGTGGEWGAGGRRAAERTTLAITRKVPERAAFCMHAGGGAYNAATVVRSTAL